MADFRNPEAKDLLLTRVGELTNCRNLSLIESAAQESPNPDQALANFETWLGLTASPTTVISALFATPQLARILIRLLGSSQSLADGIAQNPEFAAWVTDPELMAIPPSKGTVLSEGRALLKSASSFSHGLDRLRYLKQKWTLCIVINDLAGTWLPAQVWKSLSELAEGLIQLATEWCWTDFARHRDLVGPCPLSVVAFGKLGGEELNYSSDVDLIFILNDPVSEPTAARLATQITHALQEPMGRGFLYRVDLRLRPYGSAGNLTPSMPAIESYYRNYAELWEAQALIRSRVIVGSGPLGQQWDDLIAVTCFRARLSDSSLAEMSATRERVEELADSRDIKRGPGGIRDIEFLTQALQLIYGQSVPAVRCRNTLKALQQIVAGGILSESVGEFLASSYTFLRQIEHRLQLEDDLQTHDLPNKPEPQARLVALMGKPDWGRLKEDIDSICMAVREIYSQVLRPGERDARTHVIEVLGPEIVAWFDPLPESGAFYTIVAENEGSKTRIAKTLENAPALVNRLSQDVTGTELVISGEIEEKVPIEPNLHARDPRDLAKSIQSGWLRLLLHWVHSPVDRLGGELTLFWDAVLRELLQRCNAQFDVIALGSYGIANLGPGSDLDLLFLIDDNHPQAEAERSAQEFLSLVGSLRNFGAPLTVDLRLRNEGSQGLLVRTYAGFAAYELDRMEMWERFALGSARLVRGNLSSLKLVHKAAFALPVTPERLKELVSMKRRIESERNDPKYFRRNIKVGFGGLTDLEWFVHLYEMRYPTAVRVGDHILMEDRIKAIAQARLINAIEYDELLSAWRHLSEVKTRLFLLGYPDDVVPENPDRLYRLAKIADLRDGNEYLRRHEHVIEVVRSIYNEGLERLKVEA